MLSVPRVLPAGTKQAVHRHHKQRGRGSRVPGLGGGGKAGVMAVAVVVITVIITVTALEASGPDQEFSPLGAHSEHLGSFQKASA